METSLLEILDLVNNPPEPKCTDRKGKFKFGPDQVRKDWCAFVTKGKTDAQKKLRCNKLDKDIVTALHTHCCEACEGVL